MPKHGQKRKAEYVDLTSEDDGFQHQSSAPQSSAYKTPRHSGAHQLPTPPLSSSNSERERDSLLSTQAQTDDADTEISSSQDFDDNVYQSLQLYGQMQVKIVGVRYYNGYATVGEHVLLRRESSNPYDSNAIRCDNGNGVQIGHMPRQMAAKLAPFMDQHRLVVEGVLAGNKGEFDVPLDLKLYGTSERDEQRVLKQDMSNAKLPTNILTAAERERQRASKERAKRIQAERRKNLKQAASTASGVRGSTVIEAGPSKGFANLNAHGDGSEGPTDPSMDEIMEAATSFNPRELSEVVDKYGQTEDELAALPKAEQPGRVQTQLLPYQLQGLSWMLDRENLQLPKPGTKDIVQLWQPARGGYRNIATNYTTNAPKLASGGILADDMGLGKTLQIISLIAADPKADGKPTLIIAPLSVMSNWSGQVQTHVNPKNMLKVLTYHGSTRNQSAADLCRYDIVLSTYETLALEYIPAGSKTPRPLPHNKGLYSLEWRRVVLDEGHNIRNPSTKKAQAAYALSAQSRWCLTGTPIVNNLKDLYSLVKFFRIEGGLQQQDIFSSVLIRPLNQGNADAGILLKALMSTVCLRRMKDMKFIDLKLPTLSQHKYTVTWLPHEREKYEAFETEAKGLLTKYRNQQEAKGQNLYSHLLEVLLRMRQTCNHWKLCGDRITDLMELIGQNKKVDINPENTKRLQVLLQLSIDSQEECPICYESLHNPCITACTHIFGGECIERVIETQHKCPMCRAQLVNKDELIHPAPEASTNSDLQNSIDVDTSSSKVEALLNILKASRKKTGTKTIVFSQWTSFLDIVQKQLDENNFTYCRIDGKMNAQRRDDAMTRLATEPSCTVMLASLAVCSVGLNLTAASQVILSDSWWNPAIEDQAVDRVFRLGQTRDVNVFRLVMEDSIEERVLETQQEKRKLAMLAFGEKTMKRGNEKTARLADIQKLLG